MILIEALTEHRALPRLGEAKFQYLFVEQDPERHRLLVENIAALDIPQPIQIDIRFDRFELVLDELNRQARVGIGQPPTFMFVDPFGYSESGLSITGNLLQFPRCEVLYFLPLTQISRFIGTDGPAEAITALFGSEEWREAIPLPLERRNECLGDLFEKQLVAQPGIKYARSLRVHTEDGNDYRLVFGLKHLKGLQAAKDAMWKVDPLAGTEYRATGVLGQGTLFGTHAIYLTLKIC